GLRLAREDLAKARKNLQKLESRGAEEKKKLVEENDRLKAVTAPGGAGHPC
ncbi:hypothetical protein A2U01_0103974, partial [Trifolium medium]|nr:hypothetical protein [Trifolium medium]